MGRSAVISGLFGDEIMAVLHGCDLGQVGDAEDLMIFGQPSHAAGDLPGGLSAYTSVDLIKNKGVNIILAGEDCLERKHDPGELASAGDLLERPQRFSGIHGDMHGHMVPAFRSRVISVGLHSDREFHAQEVEFQERRLHPGGKLIRGFLSLPGQFFTRLFQLRAFARDLRREGGSSRFIGLQEVYAVSALLERVHDFPVCPAVLVLAAPDHIEAVFNLIETSRII